MPKPHLAPHQQKALREMHDGCILWGGVGSGKSRVAMAYYMETAPFSALVVITTAKKRDTLDWQGEAAKWGVGSRDNDSVAGKMTVDSWNNIGKYTECENCFFIFDEQRVVGSGKWVKSFLKIAKQNKWILLSATPGDTWLDYIPVFIANGHYKNKTEFIREHVVWSPFTKFPKVDRYVNTQRLVRLRSQILVHMLYAHEAERISRAVYVDHDDDLLRKVRKDRWNPYEEKPIKNAAELFYLMRKVVNSDQSRVDAVERLAKHHGRVIVFYNFNYELDMLKQLQFEYNLAEWNGHKHQEIPNTETWIYLVQYTAGSEGWNCTSTDAMVFYSFTYSYKQWEQAHGRIDRMDTPFAKLFYYHLVSKTWIDGAIWKALSAKKNFSEADAKKILANQKL
jgi:hypothetical protein